jgi:hypothetical protein
MGIPAPSRFLIRMYLGDMTCEKKKSQKDKKKPRNLCSAGEGFEDLLEDLFFGFEALAELLLFGIGDFHPQF